MIANVLTEEISNGVGLAEVMRARKPAISEFVTVSYLSSQAILRGTCEPPCPSDRPPRKLIAVLAIITTAAAASALTAGGYFYAASGPHRRSSAEPSSPDAIPKLLTHDDRRLQLPNLAVGLLGHQNETVPSSLSDGTVPRFQFSTPSISVMRLNAFLPIETRRASIRSRPYWTTSIITGDVFPTKY